MLRDYIAIDVETTGLNIKYNKLIEIAAIKVVNFEIVDSYTQLINPGINIPQQITGITGITNVMVGDCPQIIDVIEEASTFCDGFDLIGHNLGFDYGFMKQNCANHGLCFEKRGIDTLNIARRLLPEFQHRNLGFLCKTFNITQKKHHRAYYDAFATSELYQYFYNNYADFNPALFIPKQLQYQVIKNSPITNKQKLYLNDLLKHHKIESNLNISELSKSEASRMIDKIILKNGRIF